MVCFRNAIQAGKMESDSVLINYYNMCHFGLTRSVCALYSFELFQINPSSSWIGIKEKGFG